MQTMVTKTYYALGTAVTLTVDDDHTASLSAGNQLIRDYEDRLTVNRDGSEVMAINHAAGDHPVAVTPSTYDLIKIALQVSRRQQGFNATIGPLVKLWHIGFTDARVPSDAAIRARLQRIDPTQVSLDEAQHTVFLRQPGMELDLGAIAKGDIADAVARLWRTQGVQRGIIDLGGNLLVVGPGTHAGQWRLGIQSPEQARQVSLGVLTTPARSVVTSGIYERHLQVNGHDYHHMFDSQTGYPIANNLASVTIVSPRSIDGEIWTTLGFYQGLQAGLALITAQPDIEGIFVTKDHRVAVTPGLQDQFQLVDAGYRLEN